TGTGFSQSITVPAGGQIAKFYAELFLLLPTTFQGVALVTASSPISVASLRTRYNERGDFLITTTPPLNNAANSPGELDLPQIVSGSGYTSRLLCLVRPGPVACI